jgi:ZIP family zinc transporter
MSQLEAIGLGAVAGATIFLGLPIARLRGLPTAIQGMLNAFATGILVFLLWDILSHAGGPVDNALAEWTRPQSNVAQLGPGPFFLMAAIFGLGVTTGLLTLVYFNRALFGRLRHEAHAPAPRNIAMAIATGLGLHNLSEGLAIGQAAHVGAIAFAGVLVVGFALHNITEGFGIAAPMTTDPKPVSWSFLALAGLIGGGPTFVGTWIGYLASSDYLSVAFLAIAAGALLYVLNELFHLGRRLCSPPQFAWGLLLGFLTAYATDLFLTAASG